MLGASAPKTAMELGRLTLLTPLDSGSFQDVEVAGEVNGVCQGSVGLGEDGEQGAEVVYDGDAVVLDDVVNVFVAPDVECDARARGSDVLRQRE